MRWDRRRHRRPELDLGAGTHTTLISGNNVMGTDGPGIFPIVRDSGSTMTAKVLNNTVAAPITTNAARAGSASTRARPRATRRSAWRSAATRPLAAPNTATATTSPGINLRKQGTDPTINTFGIEGLAPSPTGTPTVENWSNGQNTSTSGTFGVDGTALLSAQTGFTTASRRSLVRSTKTFGAPARTPEGFKRARPAKRASLCAPRYFVCRRRE